MGRKHRSRHQPFEPLQHVPVMTREIVSATGVVREGHASCPGRGHLVPIEECSSCPRCEGIKRDGAGRPESLACRVPAGNGQNPYLRAPQVGDLMTLKPVCVTDDVSLEQLLALLVGRGLSGIPVVTRDGTPLGVVSKSDIVQHLYEQGRFGGGEPASSSWRDADGLLVSDPGPNVTAGDLMTPVVVTVSEHEGIHSAAALMANEGLHRVVVVGMDGSVVGILSALDVAAWVGGTTTGRWDA